MRAPHRADSDNVAWRNGHSRYVEGMPQCREFGGKCEKRRRIDFRRILIAC